MASEIKALTESKSVFLLFNDQLQAPAQVSMEAGDTRKRVPGWELNKEIVDRPVLTAAARPGDGRT